MSSTNRLAHAIGIAIACTTLLALTPSGARAQVPGVEVKQQGMQVTAQSIADQLGAKIGARDVEDLPVGSSITGNLTDPTKLAKLGITGMHEGARVTAFRSAPDKLRLEVDELEPTPRTQKATLKIDERGQLSLVAK
jgi:hypothetical protein